MLDGCKLSYSGEEALQLIVLPNFYVRYDRMLVVFVLGKNRMFRNSILGNAIRSQIQNISTI